MIVEYPPSIVVGISIVIFMPILFVILILILLEGVIRIMYLFTSERPPPLFRSKSRKQNENSIKMDR